RRPRRTGPTRPRDGRPTSTRSTTPDSRFRSPRRGSGVKVTASGLTVSSYYYAFSGSGADLSLDRVALTNSGNIGGGMVSLHGGSLSIRNSVVQGNTGFGGESAGGAVWVSGASL